MVDIVYSSLAVILQIGQKLILFLKFRNQVLEHLSSSRSRFHQGLNGLCSLVRRLALGIFILLVDSHLLVSHVVEELILILKIHFIVAQLELEFLNLIIIIN